MLTISIGVKLFTKGWHKSCSSALPKDPSRTLSHKIRDIRYVPETAYNKKPETKQ